MGCSMRDLSLLLEGLLQTNKGAVLKDIMNKNGLQIFHNLIKQFRRQWEKIPILRKLLKVLSLLQNCVFAIASLLFGYFERGNDLQQSVFPLLVGNSDAYICIIFCLKSWAYRFST
jgi:hypothetical protein